MTQDELELLADELRNEYCDKSDQTVCQVHGQNYKGLIPEQVLPAEY